MRLAIFGGTGRTGRILVEKALSRGYEINLLARDPARITAEASSLRVIQGDAREAACVEQVIQGAEVVISVMSPASNHPEYAVSQAMRNILEAMQKSGVHRLVVSTGAGVGAPDDKPGLLDRLMSLILKATARYVYEDMQMAIDLVRKSDLEWTVVRAPMLTDSPKTGRVKAGTLGKGMGMRITREDFAEFILEQVQEPRYIRKSPVVSNE